MTSQSVSLETKFADRSLTTSTQGNLRRPSKSSPEGSNQKNYKAKAFEPNEVFGSGGAWSGSEGHWHNAIFDLRSSFGGLALRREGARWRDWLVWQDLHLPKHRACELYFDLRVVDEQALYMLGLCDPSGKEGPAFAYDFMVHGAYVCHGQSFSDYERGTANHRVNLQIPAGARQHWRWSVDTQGCLRRASLALDGQDPVIWTPNTPLTAKALSPCLAIAHTAAPIELAGLGFDC